MRGKGEGPDLYSLLRTWQGKNYSHFASLAARKQRVATLLVSLLSHPTMSHLEAWDEAWSRFLCFPSTQLSEVPGFLAAQTRNG